jgi:hypothetical protein
MKGTELFSLCVSLSVNLCVCHVMSDYSLISVCHVFHIQFLNQLTGDRGQVICLRQYVCSQMCLHQYSLPILHEREAVSFHQLCMTILCKSCISVCEYRSGGERGHIPNWIL